MAGFFLRNRHGRRQQPVDRFDQALGLAHRWFLDRVGEVAVIQYVTAPAEMDWWRTGHTPPLITGGMDANGQVGLTLHRKFIELKYPQNPMLPEILYELLVTEWAALSGKSVAEIDPEL